MSGMSKNAFWKVTGFILVLVFTTVLLAVAIRKVLAENTIGADFYIYWRAGRAAYLDHQSPYDEAVTRSIQMGIMGRLAEPGEDQLAYAYPAYGLLIILPYIWLDFPSAQATWMAIHLVGWIVTCIMVSPRRPWLGGSILLFYPLAFGILLGNYNVVVGLAMLALFGLVFSDHAPGRGRLILGGIFLAISAIKPQFIWLPAIFGVLLACRWRYWWLLASSGITLSILVAVSLWIFPGWVPAWIEQSKAYSGYITPQPLISFLPASLLPPAWHDQVTIALAATLIFITLWMLINWLRKPINGNLSIAEIRLLAWLSLVTYLVHPWPKSYEQIILLVSLFLWSVAVAEQRPLWTAAIWLVGIGISWWAFADEQAKITSLGIYGWPALFFLAWLVLVWTQKVERVL